jgi:hypothetical protein
MGARRPRSDRRRGHFREAEVLVHILAFGPRVGHSPSGSSLVGLLLRLAGAPRPPRLAVLPTNIVDEDRHRGQAVERGVWSAVIVEPQPPGEGPAAFGVGAVQPPVGPLIEQGLVEPLDLAVGLGPVAAGPPPAGPGWPSAPSGPMGPSGPSAPSGCPGPPIPPGPPRRPAPTRSPGPGRRRADRPAAPGRGRTAGNRRPPAAPWPRAGRASQGGRRPPPAAGRPACR